MALNRGVHFWGLTIGVLALVGCSAGDKPEPNAAAVQQRAVVEGTASAAGTGAAGAPSMTNITFALPAGKTLSDVALVGNDGVIVHDRSQVKELDGINFGTVVANGTSGVNIGVDGITGDVWSRGAVTLRGANTAGLYDVRGNVVSGAGINLQNNARISGQSKPQSNFATQSFTYPVALPVTYPTAVTTFGPDNMNARLTPGTYGDTTLYSRSRLTRAEWPNRAGVKRDRPSFRLGFR